MKHIKIKLNGVSHVVLCSGCDKIIRPATVGECLDPTLYPQEWCDKCLEKKVEEFKHWT